MQLSFLVFFSLLLPALSDVNFKVTVTDDNAAPSNCSIADWTLIKEIVNVTVTSLFDDYLSTIPGGSQDSFEISELTIGSRRQLQEDEHEEYILEAGGEEDNVRRLRFAVVVVGKGACSLCPIDNSDRGLLRRVLSKSSWNSTKVNDHINHKLTNQIQWYLKKEPPSTKCVSSYKDVSATFSTF